MLTEENVGSPKPLDMMFGSSWLAENMHFVTHVSSREEEQATVASYSDTSDEDSVHIDTVMRYLKIHMKKLWPLVTFQNHMRSVVRSGAHTSELQPLMRISYAVFCLKKNK